VVLVFSGLAMLCGRSILSAKLAFCIFFLSATTLFFAQSRTTLVAIIILIGLTALFSLKNRRAFWGFSFLIIVSAVNFVVLEIEINLLIEYFSRGQEDQLQSVNGRIAYFETRALPLFFQSPVIGNGFDAGVRAAGFYHFHNSHAMILANSGALGYLMWLLALLACAFAAFKVAFKPGSFFIRLLVLFFFILFIVRSLTGTIGMILDWPLFLLVSSHLLALRSLKSQL